MGAPKLGLRANLAQFCLLVAINAFVGAMVGLERTALPLTAVGRFGLNSKTALLSFIASFGGVKAATNLLAGRLSEARGRKPLLVIGWIIALPIPVMIALAPDWRWVIAANILLGINQGLCWSMTVIMKIDLAGTKRRGLAMGLNEFAGYVALSIAAFVSGTIFIRDPMALLYVGIAIALVALVLSFFLVRESKPHANHEARLMAGEMKFGGQASTPPITRVIWHVSWQDRALRAVSQAGLVNNLNDAAAWGLLPLFLQSKGASITQVAAVAATYPGVWGVMQLVTGALSDRIGRKWLIAAGMWTQAVGFLVIVAVDFFPGWMAGAIFIGLGTAASYPTLLASVSDLVHPRVRATAVGIYRLWRDLGYVFGALFAGVIADLTGTLDALVAVAALTFASGLFVAAMMDEPTHDERFIT